MQLDFSTPATGLTIGRHPPRGKAEQARARAADKAFAGYSFCERVHPVRLQARKSERKGNTPGVLYRCERKGLAKKGICKSMKTKGEREWVGCEG